MLHRLSKIYFKHTTHVIYLVKNNNKKSLQDQNKNLPKFINMDREKLRERFLRIYFIDDELLVDVNENSDWEEILNQKARITKIESSEWIWNLQTGEITFH